MKTNLKKTAKALGLVMALAVPLAVPGAASAHDARAHSPARHLLGQMVDGGLPVAAPWGRHDRTLFERHGFHGIAPALVGSWSLGAFRSERHGMIRLYPDGDQRFTIEEDGRLSFSLGCNRFSARMMTGRRDQIEIGPIAGTRRHCPPDEVRLERRVTELLGAVARYDLRGETLRFRDGAGTLLLEFHGGAGLMHPYRADR